jgi:hypothetical protein
VRDHPLPDRWRVVGTVDPRGVHAAAHQLAHQPGVVRRLGRQRHQDPTFSLIARAPEQLLGRLEQPAAPGLERHRTVGRLGPRAAAAAR